MSAPNEPPRIWEREMGGSFAAACVCGRIVARENGSIIPPRIAVSFFAEALDPASPKIASEA